MVLIAALMTLSTSAYAQEDVRLVFGDDTDGVLRIARLYGSAAISRQQNGDPLIAGAIENLPYALRFLNCRNANVCEDLNFRIGFQIKPSPETINSWNASKRFSRAYLDAEGDAILEMDAVISGGVSAQMLTSTFEYWRLSLSQFTKHIGFN